MGRNAMVLPLSDDQETFAGGLYKFVYSKKEKEANKFRVIKHFCDAVRSNYVDHKLQEKWLENMNIHMGRWENTTSNNKISINLPDGKTLNFGRDKTRNHPYLDIITQSIATDFNGRPTHIKITDTSKYAMKLRSKKMQEIIKEKLNEIFVKPELEKATMAVDSKYGDPLSLPEEALMQRNDEINKMVLGSLSEDVKKMLDNQELPSEKLQKRLFDICHERNDMKMKFELATDYMLSTSLVAFRQEFGFGEVYFYPVSPSDFTFQLSYDSIMFEDGLHANVKRYLSPMEIIQEAFHVFKSKEWKDIEKMFTTIPSSNFMDADIIYQRTGRPVDMSHSFQIPIVDGGIDLAANEFRDFRIDSRDGLIWINSLASKLNEAYMNRRQGIIVDHPVWRWTAKAKMVTRVINGRKVQFIRGEDYEMDSVNGDVDVYDTIIPQTYKAKVFGDRIYTEMEPVKCQYLDPFDMSRPKLNVFGAQFMIMDGDVKNLAPIDPAKIYQSRYSEAHEAIGDAIASDLGTVLFVNRKTFESHGGPEGFFDMLYKLKTVVTEDASFPGQQGSGQGNVFVQNFSSGGKINDYIGLAQFYQSLMVKILRYTEAKLGGSGQYENTANIQASLAAPDRQMGRMHSIMLKIKNNVHEAMAKAAVVAYENNEELLTNYLDEELYIHFRENYDEILGTKFKVETTSSLEEFDNLRQYKSLLVNYMATGGDLHNLPEALEAKDMAMAKELGKATALRKERQDMEARRHEKELAELNSRTLQNIENQRQDREDARFGVKIDAGREQAYLYSMAQANAADVNGNSISDSIERDKVKSQVQERMHNDEMKLKEKELLIKEKAISVKNQKK